ncbi:unnamed protein product [Cladocopium goreaui]|uniref:Protein-tyrosine-phosphatase n=1 Tax=Cladocopium goreaui TaxID=2562237 RepID=A0A9P1DVJ1_9DINO|nr:unnamed protein product [Cladocopium goreaui]
MAMPVAMPAPIVKAVVKPVAKPSQWVYAAPLQSTPGHQKPNAGLPKLVSMKVTTPQRKELPQIDGQVPRDAGVEGMHPVDFKTFWEQNQQNMVVVDLRGEDRASGHIAGTVHVRAMDLLKEIQKFAEMFRDQPIVAFFCKYSAHRAPTAHDLRVQQMETTLSKKACDELALKVGKDVSKNHQSMIVIDLRGKDRASGAIPGTAIIPAMDLLKEIGKYVKDFGPKSFTYFPISLRLWHFSASIQLTELPPWLDVSPFESNTFSSVKVASGDERPI